MSITNENWFQKLFINEAKAAKDYHNRGGSGGSSGNGSSGKVLEVATADEMDKILANATANDVGRGYLYMGETTDAYESYCVYIIREE